MKGRKQEPYEIEILHKEGNHYMIEVTETPIFDGEHNVIAVKGIARDITDQRTKEYELEKYRNHLERLVKERTEELAHANEELQTTNETVLKQKEEIEHALKKLKAA